VLDQTDAAPYRVTADRRDHAPASPGGDTRIDIVVDTPADGIPIGQPPATALRIADGRPQGGRIRAGSLELLRLQVRLQMGTMKQSTKVPLQK